MSELHMNIYPNPAPGKTTVTFNALSESSFHLELCDLTVVQSILLQVLPLEGKNQVEIPLGTFAKGMYLLHMRNGDQSETSRLNVE
jgi:hypothetical protein